MHNPLLSVNKLRFVHYTNSEDALAGILKHGFIINPCQRKTLRYFTDRNEFNSLEPQYFGMVCLHGFKFLPSIRYWNKYGPFGIEMHPEWVASNGFHQVLYMKREGIQFRKYKHHFDDALAELDTIVQSRYPDDEFRQMAYTNKNAAGVIGAKKWVQFLSLFEYMEPEVNAFEKEWRFVRKEPFYNNDAISVIVDNLDSDRGWSRHVHPLKFDRSDVVRLYVNKIAVDILKEKMPDEYLDIPIDTTLNKTFQRTQSLTCLFR